MSSKLVEELWILLSVLTLKYMAFLQLARWRLTVRALDRRIQEPTELRFVRVRRLPRWRSRSTCRINPEEWSEWWREWCRRCWWRQTRRSWRGVRGPFGRTWPRTASRRARRGSRMVSRQRPKSGRGGLRFVRWWELMTSERRPRRRRFCKRGFN